MRSNGQFADWQLFFGEWLRNPLAIGTLAPTSPRVGRAAARWIGLNRPGAIVELGGGIGGVALGLLQGGCPPERLVVIERVPELASILRRRFPGVCVRQADACDLANVLAREGIDRLAGVISCLPVKWFSFEQQQAVIEQSFALLGDGGCFLQLTNARTSPLPMHPLALAGRPVQRVWMNFLPLAIWRYRLADAQQLQSRQVA